MADKSVLGTLGDKLIQGGESVGNAIAGVGNAFIETGILIKDGLVWLICGLGTCLLYIMKTIWTGVEWCGRKIKVCFVAKEKAEGQSTKTPVKNPVTNVDLPPGTIGVVKSEDNVTLFVEEKQLNIETLRFDESDKNKLEDFDKDFEKKMKEQYEKERANRVANIFKEKMARVSNPSEPVE
jgi:hypothetical protein